MKNIRHFGIVTQDPEKSLRFYRDLLGLKVRSDMLEEGKVIDDISDLKEVRIVQEITSTTLALHVLERVQR